MDEEVNAFEALYSEFKNEMTKEDLDIILKFLLDINSKVLLARVGSVIPFSLLIYECFKYSKTLSANTYVLSTVILTIASLVYYLDLINYVKKFKSMKNFKDYLIIRKKMTNKDTGL